MFRKWLSENKIEDFDFSGEILPKASERKFWDSKCKEKYIKVAEEYLDYKWPLILASDFMAFELTGDRESQQIPHFNRRSALYSLIMGELLEYKGRFLKDIVNGVLLICEETFWGVSAHKHPIEKYENFPDITDPYIDLFAAETGSALSLVHHLFYDELKVFCPEILTRIENELNHRIVTPYLKRYDFIWMCHTNDWLIDNWNPWIISNILTVFLLFVKNPISLQAGIRKMISEIQGIYGTYPLDGGCDEGATYWGVSAGAMFEFCEQIFNATKGKINFFNDEIIQNIAKYEYRAYIGEGRFINFADGGSKLALPVNYIMYKYGKRIGDQRLSSLAKEIYLRGYLYGPNEDGNGKYNLDSNTKLRRMIFDVIYEDEVLKEPDFVPLETDILENTQVTAVRNGKWYYAAKGGNNFERHNHHDVGSFMVYYNSVPVLVDAGSGTYTKETFHEGRYNIWTMRSGWHNLPVINGCEQIGELSPEGGPQNKADLFTLKDKATEISFAGAYPQKAGIEKILRTVDMNDSGVILEDSFTFKNNDNIVSEHFLTPLNVEITDKGVVIGSEFILSANIPAKIEIEEKDFCGDNVLIKNWKTDGMNLIKFEIGADKISKIDFFLRKV